MDTKISLYNLRLIADQGWVEDRRLTYITAEKFYQDIFEIILLIAFYVPLCYLYSKLKKWWWQCIE